MAKRGASAKRVVALSNKQRAVPGLGPGGGSRVERNPGKPPAYLEEIVAPPPAIDRYPLIIGQNRTLAYVSAVFRLALIGYRQQAVDVLDELLEQDPHAYGVLQKRVLATARSKWTMKPASLPEDAPESDKDLAKKICADVEARFRRIPYYRGELTKLAWAIYYGPCVSEIHWRVDSDGWNIERIENVHTRRLAYPEWSQWRLYIWDQGPVSPWENYEYPTQAPLGLAVDSLPGKFIVYCPPVRGDYPTREGLGRQIAYWMLLKHIAARGAPVYLERFGNPFPEAVYKTGKAGEQHPGPASKEDIASAQTAMAAMGGGTLRYWVHSDRLKFESNLPVSGKGGPIRFNEWIELCDAQVSKATLGSTLTTEVGKTGGANAAADTQHKDQTTTFQSDADALAESERHSVILWLTKLNWDDKVPDASKRFLPEFERSVEDDPDPSVLMARIKDGALSGMPISAKWAARVTNMELVDEDDEDDSVLVPIKPMEIVPPVKPGEHPSVQQPAATPPNLAPAVDEDGKPIPNAQPHVPGATDPNNPKKPGAKNAPEQKPAKKPDAEKKT